MTPTEQRIASIKANPDLLRTDMDWLLSQLELAGRVVEVANSLNPCDKGGVSVTGKSWDALVFALRAYFGADKEGA